MTENNSKKLTGGSAVQLVLASASSARVALLRGAGLAFSAKPAAVDEDAVKEEMSERGAPAEDAAMALA
ncbi:MAG: Maf family protein, partial [Woeseiales bacterium]